MTTSDSDVEHLGADYLARPEELAAFMNRSRQLGLACTLYHQLPEAIAAAVDRLPPRGTLLLLGTFGMDRGLSLAARLLAAKS